MNKRFWIGYDQHSNSWYIYEDLTPSHKDTSDSRYHYIWVRDILTEEAARKMEEFFSENTGSLRSFSRDRP
jgi:hypothetical protein